MVRTTLLFLLGLTPATAWQSTLETADAPYNESEARTYMNYARAAFCEPCALSRWDCGESCAAAPVIPGTVRQLGPGAKTAVRGYIGRRPADGAGEKLCIVAFKGSTSFENWLADAKFAMTSWPTDFNSSCLGCIVHKGFAEGYAEIEEALAKAIRELRCERFSVAGHSLGAAIATLATYRIRTTFGLVADPVYLFGAPRVGNSAFVESFVDAAGGTAPPAWRVIHDRDPVPRAPPPAWPWEGYMHFPREVYYTAREDALRTCSAGNGEDPGCAGSVPLVQCMPYASEHTTYFNMTTRAREMPAECVLRSASDNCSRVPGTELCECEVIFYAGAHTSYSNPKRKAWETTRGHSCGDELGAHLTIQERVGVKDFRCRAKSTVVV